MATLLKMMDGTIQYGHCADVGCHKHAICLWHPVSKMCWNRGLSHLTGSESRINRKGEGKLLPRSVGAGKVEQVNGAGGQQNDVVQS